LREPRIIALIDIAWGGHHNTYMQIYSRLLLEQGNEIWAFCPENTGLDEWAKAKIATCTGNKISVVAFQLSMVRLPFLRQIDTITIWANWFRAFRALRKMELKRKTKASFCFFMSLDYFAAPCFPHALHAFFFKRLWSGILFHPKFTREKAVKAESSNKYSPYAYYSFLRSKYCIGACLLDEGVCEDLKRLSGAKMVIALPDITEMSVSDGRNEFVALIKQKAKGKRVIGLLGYLLRYKGVISFVESAAKFKEKPFFFVLAGDLIRSSFTESELARLQSFIDENPDLIAWHTHRLPGEGVFNRIADCCDIIFAAYIGFRNSSNILTKAAALKKPVIVSKGYCMAERVTEYGLGLCVNEGNVNEITDAITAISLEYDSFRVRARFDEYASMHSVDRLSKVLNMVLSPIIQDALCDQITITH
jgi:glycosyltransferase involved in cell wall biosynthesis